MSRKLPYEKLIAEKLRRLQLPDREMLWRRMKTELDAALPGVPKRKPGFNHWWRMGTVVIALLGGTWGIIRYTGIKEDGITQVTPSVSAVVSETVPSAPGNSPVQVGSLPSAADQKDPDKGHKTEQIFETTVIDDRQPTPDTPDGRLVSSLYRPENNAPNSPANPHYQILTVNQRDLRYSDNNIIERKKTDATDGLAVPAHVSALPDVAAKRKVLLREIKKQEKKEERELAKSYRTYRSFWGESTDRWFAAGIAPYQNIAVAAQRSYHYNAATGRNIITDYIPSPYLQLHVTNRIYLLGEFQFNSPQATPSLLLSQKAIMMPMSSAAYMENIYLRKLYYFNMPVSFYYSPAKNFYLGSGLQFSSFNSGLADLEQRSSNNALLHTEVLRLKDDSLSAMIQSSEWRYLFDANYYYSRFMFGVRYNQALNSFANLRINNTLPPAPVRNHAFQLYIRYNLVVSGRK